MNFSRGLSTPIRRTPSDRLPDLTDGELLVFIAECDEQHADQYTGFGFTYWELRPGRAEDVLRVRGVPAPPRPARHKGMRIWAAASRDREPMRAKAAE